MQERLTMTERELDRLRVIEKVLGGELRWLEAAEQLGLCERQIGRLCVRVKREGRRGVIHKLRGKASNRQLCRGELERALKLVRRHYADFGPTFANEKLWEKHGLKLSTWRLRRGMIAAGIWKSRKCREKHRAWRPRRACVGQLVQLDGSEHAWFEDRAERCVLLVYIDDATSRILHGEFISVEETMSLFGATGAYLSEHGRPVAFYVDKDGVYRINRAESIEEQLADSRAMTQFSRAMEELGIEMIFAHSPQAKGRVERSFDTHQDRLVKELRLAGISDRESGNRYLREHYWPAHNRRFSVEPLNATDAHRPLLKQHDLGRILSIQTRRVVERDYTLRLKNRFFQILPDQLVRVRPKDTVLIEERLDGSVHLRFRGRYLAFRTIPKPAKKPPLELRLLKPVPAKAPKTTPYRPPAWHPFKSPSYAAMLRRQKLKQLQGQEHDTSILLKT
jgi:hypothetical protein